jgi:hypothetical protein
MSCFIVCSSGVVKFCVNLVNIALFENAKLYYN